MSNLIRLRTVNASVSTKFFQHCIGALCLVLTMTMLTFAQGARGTIRGVVTDPNGAVVPNASVKLIDAVRQIEVRTVQTNDSGVYLFVEVEPKTYDIVISSTGFSDAKVTAVTVEPNRNLQIDAALAIGTGTTDVSVTATEELVDRESATLGTTVDNRRVEGLPLDGRNVLNLALLQPGVAPAAAGFGAGLGIRVHGQRGVENNVTLDGANNNEVAVGSTLGQTPRPDAVQEFRMLTSNFEAEFGRNTGSIINVVPKSGTNEYHGNARFFYRPTFLSAAKFLNKGRPGTRAPDSDFRDKFERKEFGGNIGGPIHLPRFGEGGSPSTFSGKDRTFFFVDFEARRQLIGASSTVSGLPTPAERLGDFSALGFALIDPATSTAANPGGDPFPGNIIPPARFSPIAQYYLGFLPPASALGQAQVGADSTTNNEYFTARVDHMITNNQTLNFTYNYFKAAVLSPFAFGGATVPGFGAFDRRETNQYVMRHTYSLSPSIVNTALFGYARNDQPSVAPQNSDTPAQIGFTANFVSAPQFAGPPSVRLFDRGVTMGNSIQGPQARITENFQLQDSVSWATGDHRFKFGFDGTVYRQQTDFVFINQGIFTMSGVNGGNTTGDDLADMLIGNSPVAMQFGAAGERDYRQLATAAFAQDTWRVSDTLTLSLGVRYEYNSPLRDLYNRVAYYRSGAISTLLTSGQLTFNGVPIRVATGGLAPRGLVYVGDPDPVLGGTIPEGGVAKDKNNWAPRFGFAYSPNPSEGSFLRTLFGDRQTVIRGGFGVHYGAIIGDTALQQLTAPGFNGTNQFNFLASGTLADPFAPDPFPFLAGDQGMIPNPFLATSIQVTRPLAQMAQPIDPNIRTPYTYQYSFTIERGFSNDYVATVSYVGNRGRKLYARDQVNPSVGTLIPITGRNVPTTPAPTTGNGNTRRLNDDFRLGLVQLGSAGNSWYNALEANLQKRFNNDGLLFQVAYTFSKSINDTDTQRGQLDLLDRNAGRGLSSEDVPHRLVGSFIYEFPWFKNRSGFSKALLDGWSIGGIQTLQSGSVFSVGNPTDIDGTGGSLINFADFGTEAFTLLDPRASANANAFNAAAFRAAVCGTTFASCINADGTRGRRGSSGRNQFRLANGVNNFDFILAKKTRLWSESSNLELRFEAFNLFNRAQFTTVNLNLSTPLTFGTYADTREARIIQLGARISF